MNVDTIHTLPEMEKIEDGFAYPKKYHNKLFVFKGQFILFREASYDTFPKMIIDTVVASALEGIKDDLNLPSKEVLLSIIDTKFDEMIENNKRNEPVITEDRVKEIIREEIANAFQNVNRVIENVNDKLAKKIDLEDLQTWRTSIDQGINNLFLEHTSNYPEDSVQNVLGRLDKLEESNTIDYEKVITIVHKELSVVKKGMQQMIDNTIKSLNYSEAKLDNNPYDNQALPEIGTNNTSNTIKTSGKVKFTELALMKELGFSINEIAEAKQAGII